MTRCVSGSRLWISSIRLIASTSPVGGLENLYAPWLVPIATASASIPVRSTNSTRLLRIGELRASGPVAVLDPADRPELALDADTHGVRPLDHGAGDAHVVFEVGRRLAVLEQRAVHHHAREALLDRRQTGLERVPVILVQRNRHLGVQLDGGLQQMDQEPVAGVLTCRAGSLDDHRRPRAPGSFHHRLHHLHVVDVERTDAVTAGGGLVEQLARRDERHVTPDRATRRSRSNR